MLLRMSHRVGLHQQGSASPPFSSSGLQGCEWCVSARRGHAFSFFPLLLLLLFLTGKKSIEKW